MSPIDPRPPLIVIIGPTAVGKTTLAIQLAARLDGEIISADSRLFYRGMDIGTAKPTLEEMLQVPHHLINVANPDETWSLAIFQQKAREIINHLHELNKLPFLVGGTGQYIRAVTEGWTPPEVLPDPRLRSILESLATQYSPIWLHEKLRILDPISAERIDARNLRRTVRALEVIFTSGQTFSTQRGTSISDYRLITIGLKRPRPELYARIDERIENMFAQGLLGEVTKLLENGYTPDIPSMTAIGYRESIAVVQNKMTLDDAKVLIKRLTRIFVRRQGNWFKEEDPQIQWFDMNDDTFSAVEKYIRQSLTLIP
ncbi:MAG: tRNA (adenosine(37)-N6)-dimethylallyltransferase MiaA [Chloroflexota bacterium]